MGVWHLSIIKDRGCPVRELLGRLKGGWRDIPCSRLKLMGERSKSGTFELTGFIDEVM